MAISNASAEFNTFVRGIITEANPLTYPENASLDEENFVLYRDGSRQRRLGIDYESNYGASGSVIFSNTWSNLSNRLSTYRWDNVAGDPTLSIGVVQFDKNLFFLDLTSSNPSNTVLNSGLPVSAAFSSVSQMQFSTIGGKLAVAVGKSFVKIYKYDSVTDTISTEPSVYPKVRDIWGDEDLVGETRPASLTSSHQYNLYNQGWYKDDVIDQTDAKVNPADDMFAREGVYPSSNDIWFLGKRSSDIDRFHPEDIFKAGVGNTPAPKGHYIISPFNRSIDRKSESGISSGITEDTVDAGISTIASFAGRLFYAGITVTSDNSNPDIAPIVESMVMFSQVMTKTSDLEKCYQEADPTAEVINDLIATDGGTIIIQGMGLVHKMLTLGIQLIIFAEYGIWAIRGSDEGFSATNYQVIKVSKIGSINASSIVEVDNGALFWSESGIYTLQFDSNSLNMVVNNIIETTIQTFYNDIPSVGKVYSTGHYDESSRKVTWLYNDEDSYDGITFVDRFNKELIFDLTLKAFYKYSIPAASSGPVVAGYLSTPHFQSTSVVSDIVEGADDIVEGADDITYTENVRSRGITTTKYLTIGLSNTTFPYVTLSEYRQSDYLDWYTFDSTGIDAAAFLETGYFIVQDTQRDKQAKYLTMHLKRTETGYELDGNGNVALVSPSSCLVQSRWDFSDSANSGKWGTQFQAYRLNRHYIPSGVGDSFDYGYDVVTTKNKIRGRGKALRLRMDTEAGKDMYLLGWGMTVSRANEV